MERSRFSLYVRDTGSRLLFAFAVIVTYPTSHTVFHVFNGNSRISRN